MERDEHSNIPPRQESLTAVRKNDNNESIPSHHATPGRGDCKRHEQDIHTKETKSQPVSWNYNCHTIVNWISSSYRRVLTTAMG